VFIFTFKDTDMFLNQSPPPKNTKYNAKTKRLTKDCNSHFAELQEGGRRQNSYLHYHNGNCATNLPGLRAGEEDTSQLDGEV